MEISNRDDIEKPITGQLGVNQCRFFIVCLLIDVATVYGVGGRGHLRLQFGERGQFQRRLQLPRENGAVSQHWRNPAHPRRHPRSALFICFLLLLLLPSAFRPFPQQNRHSIRFFFSNRID